MLIVVVPRSQTFGFAAHTVNLKLSLLIDLLEGVKENYVFKGEPGPLQC